MRSMLSSIALLPLLCWLGEARSKDRFTEARSKSFPVKISDSSFTSITAAPRDYGNVVLLTAMDARYGCGACQQLDPEWQSLARVWQRNDKGGASRIVFSQLDFADGRNTFQNLGLQHAPVLFYYPPTEGPNAKPGAQPVRYEFTAGSDGATAEGIHNWLKRQLPDTQVPKYTKPFNYLKLASLVFTSITVVTGVVVAAPYLAPIIQNRNVWAAASLLAVLLFTSGHMYNHIRKVPYVAGDGRGGVSYFAGGFQNQFGMETQIIACLYGLLSFASINLALKVPRIADPRTQQASVLIWGAVIYFLYSFLLHIFKWKNGGYPFYLPPF